MNSIKFFGLALCVATLFGCDKEFSLEKDDVVRFDFDIASNGSTIMFDNNLIEPFTTEELSGYEEQKDDLEKFEVTDIAFRIFSCTADNDSNRIYGYLTLHGSSADIYKIEPYNVGNEYQDSQNHSIYNIEVDVVSGAAAYAKISEEILASTSLTINSDSLQITIDTLACKASVYVAFTVKN